MQPFKVERLFSPQELQAEVFPSRCIRWIKDKAKAGAFGDVIRDGKGWLIPASGVQGYLERNRVQVGAPGRRYHFSTAA